MLFLLTADTTSPEWEDIMKIDKKITALGFGRACILWLYIYTCLLIPDPDNIQKNFPNRAGTPLLIKIFSDLVWRDQEFSYITNENLVESPFTNSKTLLNWKKNWKKIFNLKFFCNSIYRSCCIRNWEKALTHGNTVQGIPSFLKSFLVCLSF